MLFISKRLSLGIFLIGLASAILLISDWNQRNTTAQRVPTAGASAEVLADQAEIYRPEVAHRASPPTMRARALEKKWRINIIEYITTFDTEEGERGVLAGLRDAGLIQGRDYEVTVRNAHGDIATLSALVDAAVTAKADLLIAITTPALQAALRRGKGNLIVFAVVSDAIAAGAGRKDDDHLPNVTGIHYQGAYLEMLRLIREHFRSIRVLGTLFAPGEVNMLREKERLLEAAQQTGIEIMALAVNSSGEVAEAALSLANRKIDAICNLPGNLTSAGFPSVVAPARNRKIPIFAFQSAQAQQGAVVVLARDYFDSGREAGLLATRVIRGENPASIPFQAHSKNSLVVNLQAARDIGLAMPSALVKKAEKIIGK